MSESTQPYDSSPQFPDRWGEVVPPPIEAIRARVDAALHTVERRQPQKRKSKKPAPRQRFWTTHRIGFRYGTMHCWCGATIETSEDVRDLNRFLQEHEECQPKGNA